jgi:hypothetical protein
MSKNQRAMTRKASRRSQNCPVSAVRAASAAASQMVPIMKMASLYTPVLMPTARALNSQPAHQCPYVRCQLHMQKSVRALGEGGGGGEARPVGEQGGPPRSHPTGITAHSGAWSDTDRTDRTRLGGSIDPLFSTRLRPRCGRHHGALISMPACPAPRPIRPPDCPSVSRHPLPFNPPPPHPYPPHYLPAF